MQKTGRKILFFTEGPNPSEEDLAAADRLGTTMFRNAEQAGPTDPVEHCDAVAGAVPTRYSKYPRADAPESPPPPPPPPNKAPQSPPPPPPATAAPWEQK